jgi:hypothetical protein
MLAAKEAEEAEQARIRKERSESGSTTPGPGSGGGLSSKIRDLVNRPGVASASKGKRVKV